MWQTLGTLNWVFSSHNLHTSFRNLQCPPKVEEGRKPFVVFWSCRPQRRHKALLSSQRCGNPAHLHRKGIGSSAGRGGNLEKKEKRRKDRNV